MVLKAVNCGWSMLCWEQPAQAATGKRKGSRPRTLQCWERPAHAATGKIGDGDLHPYRVEGQVSSSLRAAQTATGLGLPSR